MKNDKVIIRVEKGMKDKLENLAKDNKRNLSDYLRLVMEAAINKKLKV
jgi:predicted DNA-binding protein